MMADQTLYLRLKAELTAALRAGEVLKLSVLRMLVSELGYKQIEVRASLPAGRQDLTDEDVVVVLNKEAKKRREAIESFTKGNRPEQAQKEQQELEILQVYMPKMLTEEEIRNEILKIREIDGITEFGQVMKVVAPRFKGRADGGLVARLVNEKINQS